MNSSRATHKSPLVRLTPNDVVRIMNSAIDLLSVPGGASGALGDTGLLRPPRWYLARKDDHSDYKDGSAEEIAPLLDFPRVQQYVNVDLYGVKGRIEVSFTVNGARISISSEDAAWFQYATLWANETLRSITPKWSWVVWNRTRYGLIALGALAGIALSWILAVATDIGLWNTFSISISSTLAISAIGIALTLTRRTVIRADPGRRARGFFRELSWVVAGAAIGIVLTRLVDVVWPAA